jgi:ubiquinol-cytochrome c reductase core subunit 2
VKSFASKAFAKGNIAVLGTGISTEALSSAVSKAFGGAASASGGSPLTASGSKYYGGEQRVPLDGHSGGQPTMLIAYGTTELSPELAVIPQLIGGESALKWVPGSTPLALAAAKVPGAKISSFILPYSDASLVGVQVTAPTSEGVKQLAQEAISILKGLGEVAEEDVKKAVAGAKFKAASLLDDREGILAVYGPKLLEGEGIKSVEEVQKSFEGVSAKSLSKVSLGRARR